MALPRFQNGLIAALMCVRLSHASAEDAAQIEEMRSTITGIVELQSQASKENRDWEARRDAMAELMELHRREISLLDEELKQSGRSAPGHAKAVESAEQEISRLREVRSKMVEVIEQTRPRVIALANRFPRPLRQEIEPDFATLDSWDRGDEPRDALQAMLGILSKASQFNRRITRSLEVVDSREVEVFYLGLARAYYADRSSAAGIGRPASTSWEWRSEPGLNRRVLKAFEILDQKQPPSRIDLPLIIE